MKTALRLTFAAFGLVTFNVSAATLYVSLESANPVPPFATWANAATNIQDAVDVARAGDTVLVTNGVYATGGNVGQWFGNRVSVTSAIRLESVNGPLATTIDGDYHMRCVYLGSDAILSGFTLTKGSAVGSGGVWSEPSGIVTNCTLTGNRCHSITPCGGFGSGARGGTLYNCTLTGNWSDNQGGGVCDSTLYNCTLADNIASGGGGAIWCTLYNCTLTGNSAYYFGGGAEGCTLYNCTLTGNYTSGWESTGGGGAALSVLYNCTLSGNLSDSDGGGAWGSTLYNCTVIDNSANASGGGAYGGMLYNSIVYYNSGGNHDGSTTINFCCTTPLPTNGVGNITGPPLFMDMAAGDFRLREESPCIDAGTNVMGFPMMGMDYYGDWVILGHITDPTDMLGNTRFIDGNFDGTVAWDIGAYEFNSFRPPRFSMAPQLTPEGWKLNITGAPNKWVHVQRSSDLKNWEDVWSGWMGTDGVHQCTDGDIGQKVMFYRVVVE